MVPMRRRGRQARRNSAPNNFAFARRHPQPFGPAQPLNLPLAHRPTFPTQQRRDPAIAGATGKGGQEILKTGNSFEYAVGVKAESNPKLVPLQQLDAPRLC
jgi:hypothetical protein